MIVKIEEMGQHQDEQFDDGTLVRHYAHTTIKGWLCSINFPPLEEKWSDILNVDIVISSLPTWLAGKFVHEYRDGRRLAREVVKGWCNFEHVHLRVDIDQLNTLIQNLRQHVQITGDEIAVQVPGDSLFWAAPRALDWLGCADDLRLQLMVHNLIKANRRQCHSVDVEHITGAREGGGNGMHSQFAAAALGVSGLGQKVAEAAAKKAQEKHKKARRGTAKSKRS